MDDTLVTCDLIVGWLTNQIEQKLPIDPSTWMECASKLNVLLQGEMEKQFDMDQVVAKMRNAHLDNGKTAAFAKSQIEATDEYKKARTQKAKVERVLEVIKLAKLNARIASDAMRSQLQ